MMAVNISIILILWLLATQKNDRPLVYQMDRRVTAQIVEGIKLDHIQVEKDAVHLNKKQAMKMIRPDNNLD